MCIVSGVLRLMYELMDGQVRYTLQNMGTHTAQYEKVLKNRELFSHEQGPNNKKCSLSVIYGSITLKKLWALATIRHQWLNRGNNILFFFWTP